MAGRLFCCWPITSASSKTAVRSNTLLYHADRAVGRQPVVSPGCQLTTAAATRRHMVYYPSVWYQRQLVLQLGGTATSLCAIIRVRVTTGCVDSKIAFASFFFFVPTIVRTERKARKWMCVYVRSGQGRTKILIQPKWMELTYEWNIKNDSLKKKKKKNWKTVISKEKHSQYCHH